MTFRMHVNTLHGGKKQHVVIRPDRDTPGRIFYRGPLLASLTQQQALELATALADTLEGINHEATPTA